MWSNKIQKVIRIPQYWQGIASLILPMSSFLMLSACSDLFYNHGRIGEQVLVSVVPDIKTIYDMNISLNDSLAVKELSLMKRFGKFIIGSHDVNGNNLLEISDTIDKIPMEYWIEKRLKLRIYLDDCADIDFSGRVTSFDNIMFRRYVARKDSPYSDFVHLFSEEMLLPLFLFEPNDVQSKPVCYQFNNFREYIESAPVLEITPGSKLANGTQFTCHHFTRWAIHQLGRGCLNDEEYLNYLPVLEDSDNGCQEDIFGYLGLPFYYGYYSESDKGKPDHATCFWFIGSGQHEDLERIIDVQDAEKGIGGWLCCDFTQISPLRDKNQWPLKEYHKIKILSPYENILIASFAWRNGEFKCEYSEDDVILLAPENFKPAERGDEIVVKKAVFEN